MSKKLLKFISRLNLDGGLLFKQIIDDALEIPKMWSQTNGNPVRRGLEGILSAVTDEAASDKRVVSQPPNVLQDSHRIDKSHQRRLTG